MAVPLIDSDKMEEGAIFARSMVAPMTSPVMLPWKSMGSERASVLVEAVILTV